ncbi:DUF2683 family protein [Candidatus Micrarchaeota archaeon]|nr:DUF2683 family protein [Candidatus Micrarchaeota archaeon]
MVQAVIDISEHANRVLAIVKAKYSLNDKSQAIELMAREYEEKVLEPALRPEYVEKLKRIEKEPRIKVSNFRKHFGLKA